MEKVKRKRTGKWYNENEKKTLLGIGLTPTKQSGAGFTEKEDGYNDKILAQLKSTDASSYRLTLDDLEKLKYHAMVEHKLPLFIIQFLSTDELYLVLKYEDIKDICLSLLGVKDISDLKYEPQSEIVNALSSYDNDIDCVKSSEVQIIKSNSKAREKFHEKRNEEWEKRKMKNSKKK
jgi:hypothetical protein